MRSQDEGSLLFFQSIVIEKQSGPFFVDPIEKSAFSLDPFVAEGSSRLYLKLGNSHLC